MPLSTFLDTPLDLQRAATAPGPSGAPVRTFATVTPAVPCGVAPASDRVVNAYQQRKTRVDYTLYAAGPLDVRLNDRLSDPATGTLYVVQDVKPYRNRIVANLGQLLEIHCRVGPE